MTHLFIVAFTPKWTHGCMDGWMDGSVNFILCRCYVLYVNPFMVKMSEACDV